MLTEIAKDAAAGAAELRQIRAAHGEAPMVGAEGFGQIAAAFGLRQYEAVHEWAHWAMAQLDEGPGNDE